MLLSKLLRSSQVPKSAPNISHMSATDVWRQTEKRYTDISQMVPSRNSKYMFLDVRCAFKNAPVWWWMKSAKYTWPLAWPNSTNQRGRERFRHRLTSFAHNKDGVCGVAFNGEEKVRATSTGCTNFNWNPHKFSQMLYLSTSRLLMRHCKKTLYR